MITLGLNEVRSILPEVIGSTNPSRGTQNSHDRKIRIEAAEAAIKLGYTKEIMSKYSVKLNTLRGWVGRYKKGTL